MSANFQRWMAELVAWQMGQNATIQNAAAAAGYGLDSAKIGLTPFPGTAQPVTINAVVTPPAPTPPAVPSTAPIPAPATPTPPAASSIGSWLLPLVTAAGLTLGAGGLGVGTGLISLGAKTPVPLILPQTPVAQPPAAQPAAETVTWVSGDGGKTWKEVPLNQTP